MNRLTLLASIMAMLYVFPGLVSAKDLTHAPLFSIKVAKSGCCKVRKSSQHPWAKTNKSFGQCEDFNSSEGDKIYKNTGQYWWDRSC